MMVVASAFRNFDFPFFSLVQCLRKTRNYMSINLNERFSSQKRLVLQDSSLEPSSRTIVTSHFFPKALAIVKTAHSVPVHHSQSSCWQSRGTPLPDNLLPGTPVANANGHILVKSSTPPNHLIEPRKDIGNNKTVGVAGKA